MRSIAASLAAITAILFASGLLELTPLALLASALSAVGLAALRRSGVLAAAAYMASLALLAASPQPLLAPLAEAAAFLSLYANELDEFRSRLSMRGYDVSRIEAAFSRAGLVVSLWSAAASYALYFVVESLLRMPAAVALALSAISLAAILILSLGGRRRDVGRRF
ncbi:MAG: hypothetical protein JHC22_02895 [Thermoproteus sp.]|jgi:hypothetical protein|nr:hypothetical protein [Thermoproteus sp.]